MRVLVATSSLDAGGLDVFVRDEVLAFRDWEVDLLVAHTLAPETAMHGRRIADELRRAGVEVVELRSDHDGREAVRRFRPDVVAAHGVPRWFLELAHQLEVPLVETLHGPFGLFEGEEEEARSRAALVTAFACVSEETRRRLLEVVPTLPPARAVTITNGVDPRLPQRSPPRDAARSALGLEDELLVVSTARYCLQKNTFALVSTFLEAAPGCPGMHLVVAGRADDLGYASHVLGLTEGAAGADRVHLRGNTATPGLLLQAGDAFALNSFFEGWSLSATEAAVHGMPLVLSEVASSRAILGLGPDDPPGPYDDGVLVPHPLGDATRLSWPAMAQAQYRRQESHEDLVQAWRTIWQRGGDLGAERAQRALEQQDRFRIDDCLAAHLQLLQRWALGRPEEVEHGG